MGMMATVQRALGLEQRNSVLPFDEWVSYFSYNNNLYPFRQTLAGRPSDPVAGDFTGFDSLYKSNGIVFACMAARQSLFSEARFQFRELEKGRPGDLFGNQALEILEKPWKNGTTGDLLSIAISHADLGGNFFAVRRGQRVGILRPDWVTLVIGSPNELGPNDNPSDDVDAEIAGYVYTPGGPGSGRKTEVYLPEFVGHFMPIPDPTFRFRGMSWLTPIIREIQADTAATRHKLAFFENGATPNIIVTSPITDPETFKRFVEMFRAEQEGVANAYKTLILASGATGEVVGSDLKQMDFKMTQGAGETRIAAAAGMHPVIVGLSEGLQGSSLNQGNFGAAKRLVADKTLRPLWRNFAGSMSSIVRVPGGSELWYDDRDIPFLQEDVKDAAEIQKVQTASIRQLVDAGFTPKSVIDAITAGDFRRLKHSGLMSVQLLPPGTISDPQPDESEPPQEPPDDGEDQGADAA
jgi:hypothetical protein